MNRCAGWRLVERAVMQHNVLLNDDCRFVRTTGARRAEATAKSKRRDAAAPNQCAQRLFQGRTELDCYQQSDPCPKDSGGEHGPFVDCQNREPLLPATHGYRRILNATANKLEIGAHIR